jgi:hypothetical protein
MPVRAFALSGYCPLLHSRSLMLGMYSLNGDEATKRLRATGFGTPVIALQVSGLHALL